MSLLWGGRELFLVLAVKIFTVTGTGWLLGCVLDGAKWVTGVLYMHGGEGGGNSTTSSRGGPLLKRCEATNVQ